jgi:carbonic anhydrase
VLAARAGNGSPVEENARWVARKLATADASLADAVEAGTLKIVAAVKQMHSGEVKFLDA